MYTVLVEFLSKPGQASLFDDEIMKQAANSLDLEPDCLVFDVCRDPANENRFVLYEVYRDQNAFQAHLESRHFAAFDAATRSMIDAKEVEILHRQAPR